MVDCGDWNEARQQCRKNTAANVELARFKSLVLDFLARTGSLPRSVSVLRAAPVVLLVPDLLRMERDRAKVDRAGLTWKAFGTLLNQWQDYERELGIKPTTVTRQMLEGFALRLREDGQAPSTIHKRLKMLKAVLKRSNVPGDWSGARVPSATYGDSVYLTAEEIDQLEQVVLRPALDKARDCFLIGYYTGQRWSDWKQVTEQQIVERSGVRILTVRQSKTDVTAYVPVSPKLQQLLDKYQGLPVIGAQQKFNLAIKEVARLAGLTNLVTVHPTGDTSVTVTLPKCELISSHTARRSFATNALLAGIPAPEVMKIGGWRSLSAFMQYIKTTEQETAIRYAGHEFFR